MKDKLKEINGKYYQECEVVMLDTTNDSYFGFLTKKGKEVFNDLRYFNMEMPQILDSVNQHLYFLSNEEIKEGDWFINRQYMIEEGKEEYAIWKCGDITPNSNPKKIIATTDLSLGLPQPSKEFIQAYIKAYNENKPITKVLVEMKELDSQDYHSEIDYFGKTDIKLEYELKINSSNEITIKKVKDSYTREEVIDLLEEYRIHLDDFPSVRTSEKYLTNWIEKYL